MRPTRGGLRRTRIRLLGSPPAHLAARALHRKRLRILAYHAVPDAGRFTAHVTHLADHYVPVTAEDVERAVQQGGDLPDQAVWLTFDDGDPSVVEVAQPILDRHGIRASLFVCPGLIGTADPYWWEVIIAAVEAGVPVPHAGREWRDRSLVTRLKAVPDADRRAAVAAAAERLAQHTGTPLQRRQLSITTLRSWVAAGHSVGNHSWDHPCLSQCRPDHQRAQVDDAHRWLAEHVPGFRRIFAYPNGDWAPAAERALLDHDYRLALLFDHRVTHPTDPPLRLSRIPIDADAPDDVLRARASGAFALALRLRGRVAPADGGGAG